MEHLKLTEIFHYVMVGLAVGGTAFIAAHYMIMSTAMEAMAKDSKVQQQMAAQGGMDPSLFFKGFIWFYLFMAAWGMLSLLANLASGICIHFRRQRMFSMIVAGFNCINFPFGTALGICTLIVLVRSSISAIYQGERKS